MPITALRCGCFVVFIQAAIFENRWHDLNYLLILSDGNHVETLRCRPITRPIYPYFAFRDAEIYRRSTVRTDDELCAKILPKERASAIRSQRQGPAAAGRVCQMRASVPLDFGFSKSANANAPAKGSFHICYGKAIVDMSEAEILSLRKRWEVWSRVTVSRTVTRRVVPRSWMLIPCVHPVGFAIPQGCLRSRHWIQDIYKTPSRLYFGVGSVNVT